MSGGYPRDVIVKAQKCVAQSAGAEEYTDPWNDTKQSDGEVSAVLELWGMRSGAMAIKWIAIAPRSTLAQSGSTW